MAIQISYTDPETNSTYPTCYVKISRISFSYADTAKAKVYCNFYTNKETRDSENNYRPICILPFFISDFDTDVDVSKFTDLRNAVYSWLVANESVFSGGTQV